MPSTWKAIRGWEGLYQVCRSGKVRNAQTKQVLAERIQKDGYVKVHLHSKERDVYPRLHRLVAETFIQNPENKTEVEHKDGNRQNNRVSNLCWVTRSENMLLCFQRRKGNERENS